MRIVSCLNAILLIILSAGSFAEDNTGDIDELTGMLDEFLANAGVAAAHERFWADDLVYTSSRGTRTTKAEIMAGFGAEEDGADGEAAPVYSADDVKLKIYGTTAVVAFRLVATPADDSAVLNYFNTGTFLKRDGVWQVVAWQATAIPDKE